LCNNPARPTTTTRPSLWQIVRSTTNEASSAAPRKGASGNHGSALLRGISVWYRGCLANCARSALQIPVTMVFFEAIQHYLGTSSYSKACSRQ
jgi:hypothetical protein